MEKVMKCNRKIKIIQKRQKQRINKEIYEISKMVKIRKKERKTENKTGIESLFVSYLFLTYIRMY